MGLVWNWFGLANVLASVLLLFLALLFLKAKRTEFTLAFAAYGALAAGQKLTGGVGLYFADDAGTRSAWLFASTLFLVASTPALAHSLLAFTRGPARTHDAKLLRAAVYAPFAALVPFAFAVPDAFERLALPFAVVFMVILAAFLFPVARKAFGASPSAVQAQNRYMLAYLVIALGFSLEARVIFFLYGRMPWWELSVAYMVATGILLYGILRAHLFDVDLKLKLALRQSTVAAIFVATFFVASELAAAFFSEQFNSTVLGVLAAGVLVLAIAPIERLAGRLADRAMPSVRDTPEYLAYRRLQVYRSAYELAAEDGVVTPKEREFLHALRRDLGIAEADAAAVERDLAASPPT